MYIHKLSQKEMFSEILEKIPLLMIHDDGNSCKNETTAHSTPRNFNQIIFNV